MQSSEGRKEEGRKARAPEPGEPDKGPLVKTGVRACCLGERSHHAAKAYGTRGKCHKRETRGAPPERRTDRASTLKNLLTLSPPEFP
jgi:hypothetical protein